MLSRVSAVLGIGTPQSVAISESTITVSEQLKQEMRYGIDANVFDSGDKQLARAAVVDIRRTMSG